MEIIDLYTAMKNGSFPVLKNFPNLGENWGIDAKNTRAWLNSPEARAQEQVAIEFLKRATEIVSKIESVLKKELPGTLALMPSYGDFDGFARYDSGLHCVLLGIDHPAAHVDYLTALTAHELSHVYRDHEPAVWAHLGKPLSEISRREYLDAGTAEEHLVSEGLATLFSQHVFPEIHPRHHHYYEESEWEWCLKNHELIDEALANCLRGDQNVWSFYAEHRVDVGSPSRTHYYWAAKKILENHLNHTPGEDLIKLHGMSAWNFRFI